MMKIRDKIGTLFLIVIILLGIYLGWWLIFLKPLINMVQTTILSWSTLGIGILRFIGGDIVCEFVWLIGYVIYELVWNR